MTNHRWSIKILKNTRGYYFAQNIMTKRSAKILWIEDNIADVILIKEALKKIGLIHHLYVVNDGIEALDFLFRRGRFESVSVPDLIILDLNLPKKSGREVLQEIKADPVLFKIPLVILTTSNHDRDALEGFDPARSLYLVKPLTFAALIELGKQIRDFLLSLYPEPE